MMNSHVLLARATRRPYSARPEMPAEVRYDDVRGCWMRDDKPLIEAGDGRFVPTTKKCDQETGEDQKGE
jgi:hypothetical protein